MTPGEVGGDVRLDGASHVEEVGDLPSGEVRNDDPLLWRDDDETLGFEQLEGRPDRRLAHAESFDQLPLREERIGGEDAVLDQGLQLVVGAVLQQGPNGPGAEAGLSIEELGFIPSP